MTHKDLTESLSEAEETAAKRRETAIAMVGSFEGKPSVSHLLLFTLCLILSHCVWDGHSDAQ